MSLNGITCDPVAGQLPQRCHGIVSKTPGSGRNGKHLQRSRNGKKEEGVEEEEENSRTDRGLLKLKGGSEQGGVAFCGVLLPCHCIHPAANWNDIMEGRGARDYMSAPPF